MAASLQLAMALMNLNPLTSTLNVDQSSFDLESAMIRCQSVGNFQSAFSASTAALAMQ